MVRSAPINQILTTAQQAQVELATQNCLHQAAAHYQRPFPPIELRFDLIGSTAGMYRVRGVTRLIRYNPHLFTRYFSDSLAVTVPHEVAHYVTDLLYGLATIRPHGPQWKEVMKLFSADDRATCRYDLADIPHRRQRRFAYSCGCQSHLLSTRRHRQLDGGKVRLACRRCGKQLIRKSDAAETF